MRGITQDDCALLLQRFGNVWSFQRNTLRRSVQQVYQLFNAVLCVSGSTQIFGFWEMLSDILYEDSLFACFFEGLIIFRSYLINASSKPYGR